MDKNLIISILIIGALSAIAAVGDAYGFIFASKVWNKGSFQLSYFGKSFCFFFIGWIAYLFVLRYLQYYGITSTELQVLFWFVLTIVVIGIFSGQVISWRPVDQLVSAVVVAGIAWLMVRVS